MNYFASPLPLTCQTLEISFTRYGKLVSWPFPLVLRRVLITKDERMNPEASYHIQIAHIGMSQLPLAVKILLA